VTIRRLAEAVYLRRLRGQIRSIPRHIAVVMDGHRRWARERGLDVRAGHARGFDHVADLLGWCASAGVDYVTVFWASIDNLRKRDDAEASALMLVIERVIGELAAPGIGWRIEPAGRLDLLPDSTAHAIKQAVAATRTHRRVLTVAVGYDGREEIADAVRNVLDDAAHEGRSLTDLASTLTPEDIARNLWTRTTPDPDVVLRTSGEVRLSGFLLWQSAHADLRFVDVYWPGFREVDFLRVLRTCGR
jgi:short-chain Z-isoprenyl diphosphate synthase